MKICSYLVFFVVMGLVILIFPYIMTLFNRFNKDRVLIWRKFFIIISVCYLPFFPIFIGAQFYANDSLGIFDRLFLGLFSGYYFVYIISVIFIKKRINLQLSWWKFIILGTLYYLIATSCLILILLIPTLLQPDMDSLPYY